jgi:hypothetical protein
LSELWRVPLTRATTADFAQSYELAMARISADTVLSLFISMLSMFNPNMEQYTNSQHNISNCTTICRVRRVLRLYKTAQIRRVPPSPESMHTIFVRQAYSDFFFPPGHIIQYFPVQVLYPEPCTRPYEIRISDTYSDLKV